MDSTNFLARSTRSLDGVRHNQLCPPPAMPTRGHQLAGLARGIAHYRWDLWRWRRSSRPTDVPVEVTWLEATRLISHRHRRAGLPPGGGGQMQVRLAPQAVVCRPLPGVEPRCTENRELTSISPGCNLTTGLAGVGQPPAAQWFVQSV
jgi:hypothetical protein